jgi:hypothetical protein
MEKHFYFLDIWITQEDYNFFNEKLDLLNKWYSVIDVIDEFYYKIWDNNIGRINKTFFLEAFTFVDFCKKELSIDLKKITWVYKQNFLLFNYDYYFFDENWFQKLDIKNTYFYNIRYPWFNHLFRIFNDLWWNCFSINHRWDWPYNDKIFAISKLYKWKLKQYVGDIIIPFINNDSEKSYSLLYDFILTKFPTKQIVIKKTFWEMWNWVKAVDLDKITFEDFKQILKNKYINTKNTTDSFYIVPFYDIITENRVYYLYDKKNDKLSIYCVKQKNTIFDWVFELESFELYKWIEVSWWYIDKKEVINNKKLFKYIKKTVSLLWLETWVLEIWILKNWNYRFFEVNPYWWTLMFKQDQKDMYDFNYNMYINNILKNKKW